MLNFQNFESPIARANTRSSKEKVSPRQPFLDSSPDRNSELSAAFLTHILNGIAAPIFVKDRDYRWVFCNDAFCNLLDLNRSELLGKPDTEIFSPAETERWRQQEERIFSTELANVNEELITDTKGTTYTISTQRTRIENEAGQMFIVGTIQRLDRCPQVETCLNQSQQILQQILDSLPQSIFWKDLNSVYLGCNRNFACDAGLNSPQEIVGKTDYDLPWTQEESDFYRECDRQIMDANQPQLHIIETQCQANGRQIWLDTSKVPLQNAAGKAIGILGTYEDITERKHTEIALQQLNEDLENRVQKRTDTLRILVGKLRQEIQERQKAETEQQKFVALVENSSDFIGISTLDGRVLYINEAGRQLFGVRDLESALAISIGEYVFPDDREWFVRHVLPVVMQQGNWQGECRFRHFETEEAIPIEENIFVVKDAETGKPLCLAAIGRDIRERQQAEAKLQEQEQFLRTVYNGVEHLIFSIDVSENGEFRYAGWNEPTARATGVSSADATGKKPIEVFGEEAGAVIAQHYRDCWQAKRAISYEENLIFYGESTWWMTTLTPLYSEDGNMDRLIGTTFNITEQKRAESQLAKKTQDLEQTLQQLQRTQIQLLQSEKMSSLGQLVAGVAHEINNPVSFIYGNLTHVRDYTQDLLGLLEQYQDSYPDPLPNVRSEMEAIDLDFLREDLPKTIESMQVGADRIKSIVLSLRNFSRMDEADLKTVELQAGIESTLMILKNRFKPMENRPQIEVILNLDSLPPIECYAGQINQVFMNLLSNAIDAIESRYAQWETEFKASNDREITAPYRGKIKIDTAIVDNHSVSIQIADNGMGISEDVRSRIFDPFFTTKPIGKGTGMGLSICYQIIVDRHGGTLECTSELGRGTEFVIRIPQQQIGKG